MPRTIRDSREVGTGNDGAAYPFIQVVQAIHNFTHRRKAYTLPQDMTAILLDFRSEEFDKSPP